MFAKSVSACIAKVLAGALVVFSASTVSATTILNFVDYTDNVVGEKAVVSAFSLGGVTVTAHGFNTTVGAGSFSSGPFAYLDRGNAGMGVCQTITSSLQCNPASDDNVTAGEILSLSFDQDLIISSLFLRNDGHTPSFSSGKHVDVSIGAGAFSAFDIESGAAGLGAGLLSSGLTPIFSLSAGETLNLKFSNQQFYLSGLAFDISETSTETPIPTPATLPLFLSALAGWVLLSRRNKRVR